MLFAVPNTGAALAAAAKTVPWDNGVLEQLGFNSDILDMLNEDWVRYAVESRLPVHYVVGGADTIVRPESARPFYGQDNVSTLVGQTHRSIVDAASIEDIRYVVLQKFSLGQIESSNPSEIERSEPSVLHRPADPLFDLYAPKDEAYYVKRTCDSFLNLGMSTGHVWVTGPTGVGKTAALRHGALGSGWHLLQVMLGSYQGCNATELMRAVCLEIADLTSSSETPLLDATISDLTGFLRKRFRALPRDQVTTVLIEEIPIAPGKELGGFLTLVLHVILAIEADDSIAGRIQLAFSSLQNPFDQSGIDSPKLSEKLQSFFFRAWTDEEINSLIGMLAPLIKPDLTRSDIALITTEAQGSPRFVKMLFRRWRNGTSADLTLVQLLQSVRVEQV